MAYSSEICPCFFLILTVVASFYFPAVVNTEATACYFFRDIALRLWVKIFEVLSTAKTETSSGLIFHRFLIKCSLVAWSYLACSLFPWIVHPCPHHGLGFPLFMWNNYARVKLHRQALTIIAIAWLKSTSICSETERWCCGFSVEKQKTERDVANVMTLNWQQRSWLVGG